MKVWGSTMTAHEKKAPPYSVGDLVMLNSKNIRTWRAAKKLDAKLFGPFKVVRLVGQVGQSVELELPQRWRVHNVFHTSLIEPYRTSVRGLRHQPIAVTDSGYVDRLGVTLEVGYDVEGNQVLEDFEVEEIMGSHYNAERKRCCTSLNGRVIWRSPRGLRNLLSICLMHLFARSTRAILGPQWTIN